MKLVAAFGLALLLAAGDAPAPPARDSAPAPAPAPRAIFLEALARLEALERVDRSRFLAELTTFIEERLRVESAVPAAREAIRARRMSLILGLAALFDGTEALERTPLISSSFRGVVQTEEERRRRRHLCGWIRIHGRHDAVAHVCLSAAVTALAGPYVAERAGRHKEIEDAQRDRATSDRWQGFSFVDLAYDYAGIRFACCLLGWGDPSLLDRAPPPLTAFLPRFADLALPEQIDWLTFRERYQGENLEDFRAIAAKIHRAIDDSLAQQRRR
ncbi:MAG: hypothetical protein L0Z55_03160 [Planctomycetes bacterium]|nr:hypothetical protein [Planctomycetota bacterium]